MTGSPSSAMALYPSISVLLLASRRRKACPAIATGFAIKLRASAPAHKLLGATAGGRGVLCRDQRRARANSTQRTGPEVKIGATFALQRSRWTAPCLRGRHRALRWQTGPGDKRIGERSLPAQHDAGLSRSR